jgi:DNA topoisomerase-1
MDFLTQKRKYVWLADTAGLKQDRDKEKYEKAVKLAKEIEKIKDRIVKDMKNKDPKISRIATACYLIYRTAMRVGDEKDPDEADTVGATTLRKEHIKITANSIEFDFLGKDSVRWQETVVAEGHDKQFHENLKKLVEKKKPKDEIFDDITSRHVNVYYSSIVKGLTAKVFRTYLATNVVKNYLVEHDNMKGKTDTEKLYHAKLANLEAAMMCNHKRTIPKTFEQSLQKKRDTLKKAQKDQAWKKTQETLKKVESGTPKTETQKKSKTKRIKTLNEQIKKQKSKHKERLEKLELQIDLSEKTKDYNIGTSLRNYIDPRVFKAWTDEVGAEWEKLYTSALQKKFLWVKNENVLWKDIK